MIDKGKGNEPKFYSFQIREIGRFQEILQSQLEQDRYRAVRGLYKLDAEMRKLINGPSLLKLQRGRIERMINDVQSVKNQIHPKEECYQLITKTEEELLKKKLEIENKYQENTVKYNSFNQAQDKFFTEKNVLISSIVNQVGSLPLKELAHAEENAVQLKQAIEKLDDFLRRLDVFFESIKNEPALLEDQKGLFLARCSELNKAILDDKHSLKTLMDKEYKNKKIFIYRDATDQSKKRIKEGFDELTKKLNSDGVEEYIEKLKKLKIDLFSSFEQKSDLTFEDIGKIKDPINQFIEDHEKHAECLLKKICHFKSFEIDLKKGNSPEDQHKKYLESLNKLDIENKEFKQNFLKRDNLIYRSLMPEIVKETDSIIDKIMIEKTNESNLIIKKQTAENEELKRNALKKIDLIDSIDSIMMPENVKDLVINKINIKEKKKPKFLIKEHKVKKNKITDSIFVESIECKEFSSLAEAGFFMKNLNNQKKKPLHNIHSKVIKSQEKSFILDDLNNGFFNRDEKKLKFDNESQIKTIKEEIEENKNIKIEIIDDYEKLKHEVNNKIYEDAVFLSAEYCALEIENTTDQSNAEKKAKIDKLLDQLEGINKEKGDILKKRILEKDKKDEDVKNYIRDKMITKLWEYGSEDPSRLANQNAIGTLISDMFKKEEISLIQKITDILVEVKNFYSQELNGVFFLQKSIVESSSLMKGLKNLVKFSSEDALKNNVLKPLVNQNWFKNSRTISPETLASAIFDLEYKNFQNKRNQGNDNEPINNINIQKT